MSVFSKRGVDIFAPTDASGNLRKVINGEVQVWSTEVERAVYYAMVSGNLSYATKADLDADLAHDDGTVAWVVADTEALNGIYVKTGASDTGSWTKERNLPKGPQGDIGGVAYRFDDGMDDADPGTGLIRANNADLSSATELYVSKSNRYGDDLSAFLATLAGSTSTHKGYLILTAPDSETQAAFNVTGMTDAAGYVKLAVSGQGGASTFRDAERLIFLFSRTGNAGDLNGINPGTAGLAVLESDTEEEARIAIGALSDAAGAVGEANLADGGVTEAKLASTLRRPLVQTDYQDAFRKRIIVDAPLSGGDYDTIIATYSYTSLFPQGFCLDEDNDQLFILRTRDGGANDWSWIEVWDYTSLTDALGNISFTGLSYNRSFAVDVTTTFTESIVVLTEGANRFLYVSGEGSVHKYDITSLPTNLTKINPSTSTAIDAYSQIAFRNGRWAVMLNTFPLGGERRRNHFGLFNSDFTTRLGTVQFNNQDVGPWVDSSLADYFPKNQGIAMGDGYFACAMGGNHFKNTTVTPYAYQGIKLFDSAGRLVSEGLVDPEEMISKLEAAGYPCSRIETEGCYITRSGQIISMYVHLSPTASSSPENDTGGLMFFEEYSKASDSMDFTDIGRTYPKFCEREFDGIFPRSPDGIYNPITGAKFTTVVEICDFMRDLDISRVSFYTTAVPGILDVNGDALPSGGRAVIENNDNNSFDVNVHLFNGRVGFRVYNLTTTPAQNDDPGEFWGTGNPNGIITADVGAIYRRRDGGVDFAIFTKTSGSGTNTGWSAVKNS